MFTIDKSLCIDCGTCVDECHNCALTQGSEGVEYNPSKCIMCGHCLAVCPRDAIMIDGDGYDCEDVEEFNFSKKQDPSKIREMIMMRRSVRRFEEKEVPDEVIQQILEAGKYAPTAKNGQGNAFMVVRSPEQLDKLLEQTADALERKGNELAAAGVPLSNFFLGKAREFKEEQKDGIYYNAPVVIFIFSNLDLDAALAGANMGFMAQALGLGYTYLMLPRDAFQDETFAKEFPAPEGLKCAIAMIMGYPEPEYFCSVPRKNPPTIWK
ncbi:MAG: nitroreductase family protein [Parasporobacterium sp.]|nr:nitroreductase family protein [Parasporobacterium sp.]